MPNVFDRLDALAFKEALAKLPVNEKEAILLGIFGLAKLYRPDAPYTAEVACSGIQAVLGTSLADAAGLGGSSR